MSEEMAVTDNASSEDAKSSGEETAPNTAVQAEVTPSEIPLKLAEPPAAKEPENVPVEDDLDLKLEMLDNKIGNNDDDILDDPPPEYESEPEESETVEMNEEPLEKQEETVKTKDDDTVQTKEDTVETQVGPTEVTKDDEEEKRGVKRRASMAFSENGDEDFKGFDIANLSDLSGYNSVLERLEAEVTAATKDFTPVRNVMATPTAPPKASKRPRQDTDGSRPSSAMSSRSDENMSGDSGTAGSSGRVRRGGPSTEMSSPLLRVPLERGWRRELVYRAALDAHSRRNADIYYYTPKGKKLRSTREVAEQLSGTGLTLENFSFFKEPLGVDDPEKEIIRDAKLIRRVDSPVAAVTSSVAGAGAGTGTGAGAVEGKRTPKPKAPKGASPEPPAPIISPPAKLKVKSMGSRLSNSSSATPKQNKKASNPASAPTTAADNNNTAAWKKPSEDKRRGGRIANGATSPPAASSPRRRGRSKPDDTDHFTGFYERAKQNNYNVVVQIFQYLGMRDLAHCARVCKLWKQMASTPALWRHVRMKNSHVSIFACNGATMKVVYIQLFLKVSWVNHYMYVTFIK
ncbi:unnamed protein product [Diatraea saccharalis]|uniref:MBD domain-containing protein n=1 Tax=Diatraea saccharalis TaxID=40085 RepID=A0A9N9RAL3_9NEOP|nr:unnamed protein product [Diatraea saccharalis]